MLIVDLAVARGKGGWARRSAGAAGAERVERESFPCASSLRSTVSFSLCLFNLRLCLSSLFYILQDVEDAATRPTVGPALMVSSPSPVGAAAHLV